MLTAINAKILIAILAALAVIGGVLVYQRDQTEKTAAAAAKAEQENNSLRKQVEVDKRRHNSSAAHEGKTWNTYIP
jgi:uncharacterized protein HemX